MINWALYKIKYRFSVCVDSKKVKFELRSTANPTDIYLNSTSHDFEHLNSVELLVCG